MAQSSLTWKYPAAKQVSLWRRELDDPRELSQQRVGDFAQRYVVSSVHAMGYTLERLVTLVQPGPGKRALDVATGGGHVALAMARAGADVIASDLTPRMLLAAREHIRGQGVAAHFLGVESGFFSFADGALDIVTCRLAPHHFPDVGQFVSEAARVVKPGGVVGVVDHIGPGEPAADRYCNAFEKLRDPSHAWQYSQAEWEGFFIDAGLDVTHCELSFSRLDFDWWTRQQNNDPDTVIRLRVMLKQAPESARAWLDPDMPETGGWSFAHGDLILIGVKR